MSAVTVAALSPAQPGCNCSSLEIELFKSRVTSMLNMSSECIDIMHTCSYPMGGKVIIGLILSIIACGTFFGNVLVVMAVGLVKKLQNPSNLLIVSLAFSDLLVGLVVLPFSIIVQLVHYFPGNEFACRFWTSCDVLLCTSSILNLCAISIDRYLVITKPFEYAVKRTPGRMGLMIAAVWMLSACISIPPLLSDWKDPFRKGHCEYPSSGTYQLYAVFVAFYLPLVIMLVLYGNIFKLARKMAKADEKQKVLHVKQEDRNLVDEQLPPAANNNGQGPGVRPSMQSSLSDVQKRSTSAAAKHAAAGGRKKSSSDTKAIKTLGVIMGCFILCWLPFFILQLVKAIHMSHKGYQMTVDDNLFATFNWLGYLNSFLNPIIYAKFNRDFRMPFKHILLGHCRSINNRLRAEQYAEQYGLTGNSRKAAASGSGGGGGGGGGGRHGRRRSSDANARRARHNTNPP